MTFPHPSPPLLILCRSATTPSRLRITNTTLTDLVLVRVCLPYHLCNRVLLRNRTSGTTSLLPYCRDIRRKCTPDGPVHSNILTLSAKLAAEHVKTQILGKHKSGSTIVRRRSERVDPENRPALVVLDTVERSHQERDSIDQNIALASLPRAATGMTANHDAMRLGREINFLLPCWPSGSHILDQSGPSNKAQQRLVAMSILAYYVQIPFWATVHRHGLCRCVPRCCQVHFSAATDRQARLHASLTGKPLRGTAYRN